MKIKKYFYRISIYAYLLIIGACGFNYVTQQNTNDKAVTKAKPIAVKVIYGEDDRKDLYAITSARIKNFETSVVGLAKTNRLSPNIDGTYQIRTNSYGPDRKLCESESFYDQRMTTFCSGSLIGKDTILTAGHCISDLKKCQETSFIFGLTKYNANEEVNYSNIPADNVYQCKNIVHTVAEFGGVDFAVVTLDRQVVNRRGLNYRKYGTPEKGDDIFMIGKPSGLPTKVTELGKIHSFTSSMLRTDLDAYGANSGSPIFNSNTGELEGILIRGALDFVFDKKEGCFKSHICDYVEKNTQCPGEEATRISEIIPYLPKANNFFEKNDFLKIPDSPAKGIISKLMVDAKLSEPQIFVHIDIDHSWVGDLTVSLTSPTGDSLILIENNGTAGDDISIKLGSEPEMQSLLQALVKNGTFGSWQLEVTDGFSRDVGILKRWALEFK